MGRQEYSMANKNNSGQDLYAQSNWAKTESAE